MGDALPITEPVHPSSDAVGSQVAASGTTAGLPSRAGAADRSASSRSDESHPATPHSAISSPPPTAQSPAKKPRRRFRQFGLCTLLVMMALCAAAFAWYSHEIGRYKRQAVAVEKLQKLGASIDLRDKEPTWRNQVAPQVRFCHAYDVTIGEFGDQVTDQDLELLDDLIGIEFLGINGQTGLTTRGLAHIGKHRALVALNLTGTKLTDEALAGLENLQSLTYLAIDSPQVTDATLKRLTGLTRLEWLELAGTAIDGRGLASLANLSELEVLNLSRTRVDDAGLGRLPTLPKLASLQLDETRVGDAGLAHLASLGNLLLLGLSGTNVRGPGLAHVKDALPLHELYLSNTPLEGAQLVQLAGFTDLKMLKLGGTSIRDDDLVHLAELRSLELLHLDRTNIGGRGLQHLSKMQYLNQLHLDGAPLEDAELASLPELPNLEYLHALRTGFGEIAARRVAVACPKLRMLYLDDTLVTSAGIEALLQLPWLHYLTLDRVQVTGAEAAAIHSPNITVVHPRDDEELSEYWKLKRAAEEAAEPE